MTKKILTKDQARLAYGEEFVSFMMKGKKEIELTAGQRIALERWKLIKDRKFAPFAYEYVYMIGDGNESFKVGITRAPQKRLSSIQTGRSEKLKMTGLFVLGGQAGRNVERSVLTELKAKGIHIRGEWFNGRPDVWWPHIVDFARSRYADHMVSLSAAWEGCEPLVPIYLAAHQGTPWGVDVVECRKQFLWVVAQAEKGLTVAS